MNELIKIINKEKLNNLTKRNIISCLVAITKANKQEVTAQVENMINDGDLVCVDKNKFATYTKLGYLKGKIIGTSRGFAFCEISDEEDDVFIASRNLNGAIHNDEVLIKRVAYKKGEKTEGVVVKIIKHNIKTVVGTIQVFNNFAFVTPDNKKLSKDVFIPKGKHLGAKDDDKVFVKITNYDNKNLEGEVTEILGKANGSILTDVLSIIRNYELIEEFPQEVLEESKQVASEDKSYSMKFRKDFRDQIIFTIDGDDSKDFDDAVALTYEDGIYTLGVHIADVGEYVKKDSNLDKEAFNRGTSAYFPNCVLPMLPHELSDDICSLKPNEDRLTLSCIMKFDSNGKRISHEIHEGIIRSVERMTYNNVTKLLCENDAELNKRYSNILPTLKLMENLCLILEKRRKERGSIDFNIPEPKIILDDNMEVVDLVKRPRTISERIIESFMLAANETVAEHYFKNKMPFVYRTHEAPESDAIRNFQEFAKPFGLELKVSGNKVTSKDIQTFLKSVENTEFTDVINKVLLRSMQKAKYKSECLGHFGLAAEFYAHFTSPIRRYPDLTIHRIIKQDLRGQLSEFALSNLRGFVNLASSQSSEREVYAEKAERDVDDYFKARYLSKKIGERFEGIISGVTNFGLFVELDNTAEGFIPVEALPGDCYTFNEKHYLLTNGINKFVIGNKIKIIVASVKLDEGKINFILDNGNQAQ